MQIRHFRVNHAEEPDALWLERLLAREVGKFGLVLSRLEGGSLLWKP